MPRRVKAASLPVVMPPQKVRSEFYDLCGCCGMFASWNGRTRPVPVNAAAAAQVLDLLHINFAYEPPHGRTGSHELEYRCMLIFLGTLDRLYHPRPWRDTDPAPQLDADDEVVDAMRKVL